MSEWKKKGDLNNFERGMDVGARRAGLSIYLRHSDGRVRIWRKQNEEIDPSCLVTCVVWGMFSWHTLGLLVPVGHRLNATAYLSIVSDHVHPFMATMYPSSDNAPDHKARIISNWFLEHHNEFTVLKWPPQSPDLNPI